MYMGIVLVGAAHGLILLPILLTFFGPLSREERESGDEDSADANPRKRIK